MALTTDSAPHEKVGSVMGMQMIGLSLGNLLGKLARFPLVLLSVSSPVMAE